MILLTAELRCAVSPLTPLSLPCWEAVPYARALSIQYHGTARALPRQRSRRIFSASLSERQARQAHLRVVRVHHRHGAHV